MNSNCIAAGCLDAQTQIKTNFVKLYQWPESDTEFLKRKVRMINKEKEKGLSSLVNSESCVTTPQLCRYCPLWNSYPSQFLFSPKVYSSWGKDLYTLKGGHSL